MFFVPLFGGAGASTALDVRPKIGQVLAMVAYPFDPAIEVEMPAPPFPVGVLGYPNLFSFTVPGGTRTELAATEGFTTRPLDPLAHRWFAPIVADGFNYEAKVFDGLEPALSRGGDASGGTIRISDVEGRFDTAVKTLGWAGRTIELWRGPRGAAFADFERVAIMTCDGWTGLTRQTKDLKLRDRRARLYSNPLVGTTFGGTGGEDGDEAVKGRLIPWSFGYVSQVEPVVFDTANLLAKWHARRVQGVIALTVGGTPWDDQGDYPTIAALIAAASGWTNGQFGTCNAKGTVRYGAVPSHGVRIEGQGDAHGGVYAGTRGQIVRRLATTCGMLPLPDPAGVDAASFAQLDVDQPGECGWHWSSEISIGAAMDEAMGGVAGWWDVGLDGALKVQQLSEPGTVDLVIDASQPMPGEPAQEEDIDPRSRTRVGFARNYAPQQASELTEDARASLETQRLLREPSQYGESERSGVRTLYPGAREVVVLANYRYREHAEAEAARQELLYATKRARWSWPAHIDAFAALNGRTVEIRNWNRYAFGVSKKFRIAGVVAGQRAITATLQLWG